MKRFGLAVLCLLVTLGALRALAEEPPGPQALTLDVDVLTRDAKPVADADVLVLAGDPPWKDRSQEGATFYLAERDEEPLASARTGADGRVHLTGLAGGRVRVAVRAEGMARTVARTPVAAGIPAEPLRIVVDPGCRLRGTVSAKDGASADGVTVIAVPEVSTLGEIDPFLRVSVVTGPDGKYALDGLSADGYGIWTWRAGFGFVRSGSVRVPDVPAFDVTVTNGAVIRGRVRAAENGAPLAGAEVAFWDSAFRVMSKRFGPATTDAEGKYEIRTGQPRVSLEHATVLCAGRADLSDERVSRSLEAGESFERDFAMAKEAVLAGRVTDARGPVTGARVRASVGRPPFWGPARDPAPIVTDADGRYRIGGLGAGAASVYVYVEGYQPGEAACELRAGETATGDVVLVRDEENPVVNPVTVRLSGRVVAGDSPVAGAEIWASAYGYGENFGHWVARAVDTVSATDGTFSLSVTGSPGNFAVRARTPHSSVAEWQGPPDVVTDRSGIVLELKQLPSVRGKVRSALGLPVAGARIRVGQKTLGRGAPGVAWDAMPGATADTDGSYVVFLEPLPQGGGGGVAVIDEYVVAAELAGHAPEVSAPFKRSDGEGALARYLDLDAGVALRGRVTVAATGAAAAGVPVELSRSWNSSEGWPPRLSPGLVGRRTESRPDGTFELRLLTPGSYRVVAKKDGLLPFEQDVTVPPKDELRIALVAQVALAGVVVGPEGKPVAGAYVLVRPDQGENGWIEETDAAGAFRLDHTPDGEYVVTVVPAAEQPDLAPLENVRVRTGATPARLQLARGAVLESDLVDAEGLPVAGAKAQVWRGGAEHWIVHEETDAKGGLTIHACAPRAHTVTFHDLGVAFEGVEAGEVAHLRLPGTLVFRGKLVTPDGAECSEGRFEARRVSPDAPAPRVVHVFSDSARGEIVFPHMAPGRYEVRVTEPAEAWSAGERSRWTVPPGTIVEAGKVDVTIVAVPYAPPPAKR